jgi:two-component system copper resistance phosphate regulon response regulator CusR
VRILVVEDDPVIAELLQTGLEQNRFDVDLAGDGNTALQKARAGGYGLILLDIMLPGIDGWTVCRSLRDRRDPTPILMLTARDQVEDRVKGLEGGADDYLAKPFDFKELLARVRALLRRDKMHRTRVIKVADLEVDTTSRRVTRSGREIHLTPREFSLLEALVANEGRVVTRDQIQECIWSDDGGFTTSVSVHMANLRRKVDSDYPLKLIHTVYGVGYTLKGPDTVSL